MKRRGKPFQKGFTPHNKQLRLQYLCEICGTQFERPAWYAQKVGPPRTCSRICHNRRIAAEAVASGRIRAEKNPQWRGGTTSRYYRKFLKDGCERCGSGSHLLIHHRDEDRSNSAPGNLETLCKRCHQMHHDCVKSLGAYAQPQKASPS